MMKLLQNVLTSVLFLGFSATVAGAVSFDTPAPVSRAETMAGIIALESRLSCPIRDTDTHNVYDCMRAAMEAAEYVSEDTDPAELLKLHGDLAKLEQMVDSAPDMKLDDRIPVMSILTDLDKKVGDLVLMPRGKLPIVEMLPMHPGPIDL